MSDVKYTHPSSPRSLLIVEDSPTDRELLKYLLEARFPETKIHEASSLRSASLCLEDHTGEDRIDCVILDVQLPDSNGQETFRAFRKRFPDTPMIVMSHNKERQLAIDMIRLGAADYVIKNFDDEEEWFRRIVFAMEKHRISIWVQPEDAGVVRRLDRANANLRTAHQSGQHTAIREMTAEATMALADVSRRTFAELQNFNAQMVQLRAQSEHTAKVTDHLDAELLRGREGRPSMRSQVDLIDHRMGAVEKRVTESENREEARDNSNRRETIELSQAKMTNRTKLLLGILALVGAVAGAVATYEAARSKSNPPALDLKK